MSDVNAFKLLEAGVILAGLVLFVAWQWRDLKRARAKTARERAERERAERDQAPEAVAAAEHEKSETKP